MSDQATKYTEQYILNWSTDDTVRPPLLTIGVMVWNGTAWIRFTG